LVSSQKALERDFGVELEEIGIGREAEFEELIQLVQFDLQNLVKILPELLLQ